MSWLDTPARAADLEIRWPGGSGLGLWTLPQFGRVVTAWIAAFILLTVAWAGSSTDADPARTNLWVMLGLLGGVVAGAGSTFWFVVGMRIVRDRQQKVIRRLALLGPHLEIAFGVPNEPLAVATSLGSNALVRVDNGTRYHRSDCPMIAGKLTAHVAEGDSSLQPCGVCQP